MRAPLIPLRAILLLLLVLSTNVNAAIYNMSELDLEVAVETPKVILQSGTAGNSLIYLNQTSAKVSVASPAEWWDPNYKYRRQINITNNASGWLSGWSKRVKITIDSNDIVSPLSNFPILIYLSNSSGRNGDDLSFIFDELQSDADRKKIAVTTSDGTTQCYVEIEKWDSVNRQAWLWVKAPSISDTSDTYLYLYYDADHAENTDYVGDVGSAAAEKVWSNNYSGVWHLGESVGGAGAIKDSTSHSNDGTDNGNPTLGETGKIGNAIRFDGVDDCVVIPDDASLRLSDGLTIEAWINVDVWGNWKDIVFKGGGSASNTDYQFALVDSGLAWDGTLFGFWRTRYFSTSTDTGVWIYVAVTHDTVTVKCYRDGVEISSQLDIGYIYESAYQLGISREGAADRGYLDGVIDEVRISNVTRSAAWIKASYESERDDLVDYGMEEVSLPSGYSVNLTLDTAALVSAGKMLPNGYDLRIVYWNGSSWVELDRDVINMNTDSTEVWFKIQTDIPVGSSDSNYYLYYGYPSAVNPPANKSNVYLLWDDFNDRDYDGWTPIGSTWSASQGFLDNKDTSGGGKYIGKDNFNITQSVLIKYKGLVDINRVNLLYLNVPGTVTGSQTGSGYCLGINARTDRLIIRRIDDGIRTRIGYISKVIDTDVWYDITIIYFTNGTMSVEVGGSSVTATDTTYSVPFNLGTWCQYEASYDDILVRKYVWPEPSTQIGSEEKNFYDYVLRINNEVTDSWIINLQVYESINITRLSSVKISFYDGSSSDQIIINEGTLTQSEGPNYNLVGNGAVFIEITHLQTTSSDTSYIYVHLKIRKQNAGIYMLYKLIFEIT